MYIYIYINIYIFIYTLTHTHIHTGTYIHTGTHLHIYTLFIIQVTQFFLILRLKVFKLFALLIESNKLLNIEGRI